MTPQSAKQEIETRFPVLINRNMLKATIKGNVLTLSGKIEAVQAMDSHVMEKYMPTACKAVLKLRRENGDMVYAYRFQGNKTRA
ncbi:MAG: hypothetical protein WC836_22390 [Desulfobacula sp.]|jgi:hypothetical protein